MSRSGRGIFWSPVFVQLSLIFLLFLLAFLVVKIFDLEWDTKVSTSVLIGIPAAVIAVSQLVVVSQTQRASYIKDYALKFRSDKELTETFYHLVIWYTSRDFEYYLANGQFGSRNRDDVPEELRHFDPDNIQSMPQERRLDNLLGFFDTLGYDYCKGMIRIEDIAGVFGLHLDHFIQRKHISAYLGTIEREWPKIREFHERYNAPTPFRYFRRLVDAYIKHQDTKM